MRPLGIQFPTPLDQARENAAAYAGLDISARYRLMLSLLRTARGIQRAPEEKRRVEAFARREKKEELRRLVRAQILRHV